MTIHTSTTERSLRSMPNTFRNELCAAQANIADLADFVIACGDCEWRVHKFILRLHKGPLAAACQGDWKEAQQGRIDLSAAPASAIDALVQYLYRFDYEVPESEADRELSVHTQVLIAADKYKLDELAFLAEAKFERSISSLEEPNEDLAAALAISYGASEVTTNIQEIILKDTVGVKDFFTDEKYKNSRFTEVAFGNPAIARDFMEAAMRRNELQGVIAARDGEERFECGVCGGTFILNTSYLERNKDKEQSMVCPDGYCESEARRVWDWESVDYAY
ncbi:hypothetical protein CKM354_000630900 [Cercospora kikuchii]|uniref:BTB domain-containing protein n=1 Tax=Cercospora kikuchii TaxID=84275 RepID=A0A9P3FGD4_9PEZI|nr:uncharacterized protein CKM354_000630900 [Cercospora kikuchii]GIZ43067.1 hypothetical protein CKM354_000630900 [Cercospora kikuchii]